MGSREGEKWEGRVRKRRKRGYRERCKRMGRDKVKKEYRNEVEEKSKEKTSKKEGRGGGGCDLYLLLFFQK